MIKEEFELKRQEVIVGDFNIRIGKEGGIEELEEVLDRNTKDRTLGNGSRKLLGMIGNIGGYILNGTGKGDKIEEYTCEGPKESSQIMYL